MEVEAWQDYKAVLLIDEAQDMDAHGALINADGTKQCVLLQLVMMIRIFMSLEEPVQNM